MYDLQVDTEGVNEIDESLYSRQLYVLGYEAMERGEYWGSIYQSPVDDAEAALLTAIDVINGEDVPFLNYFDTPKITQDNQSEFTKPVF